MSGYKQFCRSFKNMFSSKHEHSMPNIHNNTNISKINGSNGHSNGHNGNGETDRKWMNKQIVPETINNEPNDTKIEPPEEQNVKGTKNKLTPEQMMEEIEFYLRNEPNDTETEPHNWQNFEKTKVELTPELIENTRNYFYTRIASDPGFNEFHKAYVKAAELSNTEPSENLKKIMFIEKMNAFFKSASDRLPADLSYIKFFIRPGGMYLLNQDKKPVTLADVIDAAEVGLTADCKFVALFAKYDRFV